jgi:hypothetical protein
MKRRKYHNPPAKPGPVSDLVLTFVPRADDPDPATMIDIRPGGPEPIILTFVPRADDPDPATMIDIRPGGPTHQKPTAERNGHAPGTNSPKEPSGDAR